MNKKRKVNITDSLIKITLILAPMMMLNFMHVQIYLWFALLAAIVMIINSGTIRLSKNVLLNMMIVEMFISAWFALISNIPEGYKKNAFVNLFMILIVYLFVCELSHSLKKRKSLFETIYIALKWMILLEFIWCLVQFIFCFFLNLDINQKIFVETLHVTDVASTYRSSNHQFRPSGLAHHPAIMAPLVTIAFFMFDSPYVKALCILVAVICDNATVLIAIMICIAFKSIMDIVDGLKTGRISQKKFVLFFTLFIIAVAVVFSSGMHKYIVEEIQKLLIRLTSNSGTGVYSLDSSSLTHKRYYTELYGVLKNNNLIQNLFGFGPGNSGFGFTRELGQYVDRGSWTVESDFVNKLLSYGIIGFVIQYSLLVRLAVYAYKKNPNYICLFVLLIEGITYNVQFTWVFMIELIIGVLLKLGFDIMPTNKKRIKGCY